MRSLFLLVSLFALQGNATTLSEVFTTGVTSGVYITQASQTIQDGATFTPPIWDFLDNKTYSAQIVPTGSDEKSESYAQVSPQKEHGFASAVSTGKGALEVGAENGRRLAGAHVAFSRYYTTIKNTSDNDIDFEFRFVIEPGSLAIRGIRDVHTAHARAEAFIDYKLLSPAGDFGGTNDETTGRLFNYYVDIAFDSTLTHSSNATVALLVKNDFELSYKTARYEGVVDLPTIPGHGELTVYYDMLAHLNIVEHEVGGEVFLGDPTQLVRNSGVSFVPRNAPSEVPEPATVSLLGGGLAALATLRRNLRT